MIVRMWEVRAEPYAYLDLISWVCDDALAEFDHDPLHLSSEVFTSTDQRLVVVSKWRSAPRALPDPPVRLVVAPPTFSDFTQVDR